MDVTLTIKATASQTADLLQIQDSSGADLVTVDSTGSAAIGESLGWQDAASAASRLAVRASLTGDSNEYGVVSSIKGDAVTVTANRVKAAFLGLALCNDASGATSAEFSDFVGVYGQGYINAGVATGRAWGLVGEARHVDGTSDGELTGAELAVFNEGAVQTNPDANDAKMTLWLGSRGSVKATAAIAFNNSTAGWQYGIFARKFVTGIRLQSPLTSSAVGIDMTNDANWGEAIRLPNNSGVYGYNAAASARHLIGRVDSSDNVAIGTGAQPLLLGNTNAITVGQSAATIGFYGKTAVAQQVLATGAGKTVDNVISFLQTLGLCKQS